MIPGRLNGKGNSISLNPNEENRPYREKKKEYHEIREGKERKGEGMGELRRGDGS